MSCKEVGSKDGTKIWEMTYTICFVLNQGKSYTFDGQATKRYKYVICVGNTPICVPHINPHPNVPRWACL